MLGAGAGALEALLAVGEGALALTNADGAGASTPGATPVITQVYS